MPGATARDFQYITPATFSLGKTNGSASYEMSVAQGQKENSRVMLSRGGYALPVTTSHPPAAHHVPPENSSPTGNTPGKFPGLAKTKFFLEEIKNRFLFQLPPKEHTRNAATVQKNPVVWLNSGKVTATSNLLEIPTV